MFIRMLERIQMTAGVVSLCIFFVAIVVQIVTRHMKIAVIWTEEVANYSFVWAIFMGAAVMVNRREHFSFDFLTSRFKGRKKASLFFFNDTVIMLFSFAIFFYGLQAMTTFWNYNWVALPFLKMGYVWIAIPIMGLTMFIYAFNHLIENWKALRSKEVPE
jgi:TRAP-type transport system small permease protein